MKIIDEWAYWVKVDKIVCPYCPNPVISEEVISYSLWKFTHLGYEFELSGWEIHILDRKEAEKVLFNRVTHWLDMLHNAGD